MVFTELLVLFLLEHGFLVMMMMREARDSSLYSAAGLSVFLLSRSLVCMYKHNTIQNLLGGWGRLAILLDSGLGCGARAACPSP